MSIKIRNMKQKLNCSSFNLPSINNSNTHCSMIDELIQKPVHRTISKIHNEPADNTSIKKHSGIKNNKNKATLRMNTIMKILKQKSNNINLCKS